MPSVIPSRSVYEFATYDDNIVRPTRREYSAPLTSVHSGHLSHSQGRPGRGEGKGGGRTG